ncbi:MAG: type II toxin-antitoxin system VapC family toxin [Gammaproteobacteria bacterium]|nr:type II toxin-antitoxin system VapC family toxin [Gammaproteobacteria bacterium]
MFLLDTNVISELRKIGDARVNVNVATWVAEQDAESFHISALTLLEIEIGILRIKRRDTEQGNRLREWMDRNVLTEFLGRILPVDAAIALKCAKLHVPDPRPERDVLIAATAMVHGMTVVTRNLADFDFAEVKTINPWLTNCPTK